jgi:curved DNA-binding protein CbpA
MRGEPDPYEALGLGTDASTADISRAYRRLARALHPDSRPGDASAADRFRVVSAAYELLSDPVRRTDWDRRHLRQATSLGRPLGRSVASQGSAGPWIWPLSPTKASPPHPALWAGPVRVEPTPGEAATAGLAPAEPGHGDLAWILGRLLAGPWDPRW